MDASCFFVVATGLFLRWLTHEYSLHQGAYRRVANLNHAPCFRVFLKAPVALSHTCTHEATRGIVRLRIMEYGSTPYVGWHGKKMAAAYALYKSIRSELCSRYSHKPL